MENQKISVLYVDDEETLLKLGKIFLERIGNISVEIAPTAGQGLEMVASGRFEAIISDYQMPVMDGIQFLQEVRKQFGDIPFILFTGKGREEVVIQAINEGADFYLQKGGDSKSQFAELAHKVRQAVGRKKAERAVIESEKRLSDIFDFLPDPTFAINSNGQVIAWNNAIVDLTGICAEKIIGKGRDEYKKAFYSTEQPVLIDLIDESDDVILEHYANLQRVGETLTAETVIQNPQGLKLQVLTKVSRLYDQDGNRSGTIESIRDISALKKSEEDLKESELKLRKSEQQYRMVVNDQTEMIARFTPDGTITFFNDAFRQFFAPILNVSEIEGMNIRVIMNIQNYNIVEDFLHSLTIKTPTREMERMVTSSDGKAIWQLWIVRALFDESGSPSEYQVVGKDITEKKEASDKIKLAYEKIAADEEELREKYDELTRTEKTLRESEERLVLAQEIAHAGSWEYNPRSDTFWGSAEGCAIFGYPRLPSEFSSDEIESHIEDRERVHQAIVSLIEKGEDYDIEYKINPADGSPPKYIHSRARAECDNQDKIIRITGVIQDITPWKLAQDEIAYKNVILSTQQKVAPDGILVVDNYGRILSYNTKFLNIWGINKEIASCALDETLLSIASKKLDDPDKFMRRIRYLYEHPDESSFEEISLIDGRILERFSAPMISENREYFGRVWYFRDITERKRSELELQAAYKEISESEAALHNNFQILQRSEQELRESQHRLSDIINFAPDPTFAIDTEGKVVAWNHAMEVYTGVIFSDIIGKGDYEYAIPFYGVRKPILLNLINTSDEELAKKYVNIVREGDTLTAEATIHLLSGEERIIWAKACPLYDAGNAYAGAIESMRDITEWKRTSSELKKNEAWFRTLFDQAIQLTGVLDLSGRITLANKTALNMIGASLEDVRGIPFWDTPWWFHDEKGKEALRSAFERAVTGETVRFETTHLDHDGITHFIDFSMKPVTDSEGTVIALLPEGRDITVLKKAEAEIIKERENFKAIFDNSQDAIFIHDKNGKILDVNATMCEMFRITHDKALEYSIEEYFKPESIIGDKNGLWHDVIDGHNKTFPCMAQRPLDKSIFDAEVFLTRIDTGDEPIILIHFRDVTAVKETERLLADSEEKFRTVFDLSPYACTICDHNGNYLYVNQYYEKVTGYSPSELLGKPSDEVEIISAEEQARLTRILNDTGSYYNEEITIRTKDKKSRVVLSNATVIKLRDTYLTLSTMIDVTQRHRMEDNLRKAYEQISGIADTIPGVVFQFYARKTGEMGLFYVSRRATEIFAIEGDISSFFLQFIERIHENDRASFLESIDNAIRNKNRWDYEGKYVKPSGELVFFRGISAPVQMDEILVFSGVLLDITSRKNAEDELRKEKEFRSLLFEASPAYIVAVSNDGKTLMMNHILLKALEYTAEEIKGKDYLKTFVPESDRAMVAEIFNHVISSTPVTHNKNRIISKSGKIYLVEWHGQPVRTLDGDMDFFIGVGIDITNREER